MLLRMAELLEHVLGLLAQRVDHLAEQLLVVDAPRRASLQERPHVLEEGVELRVLRLGRPLVRLAQVPHDVKSEQLGQQ